MYLKNCQRGASIRAVSCGVNQVHVGADLSADRVQYGVKWDRVYGVRQLKYSNGTLDESELAVLVSFQALSASITTTSD